jgi:hypothetical protein
MKKPKRYNKSTFEAWEAWGEQSKKEEAFTARVPALEVEEVTLADLLAEYDPAVLRQWLREQEQQEQQQTLPDKPLTNEE